MKSSDPRVDRADVGAGPEPLHAFVMCFEGHQYVVPFGLARRQAEVQGCRGPSQIAVWTRQLHSGRGVMGCTALCGKASDVLAG